MYRLKGIRAASRVHPRREGGCIHGGKAGRSRYGGGGEALDATPAAALVCGFVLT
ncbi:hypothetical protein PM3016_6059 [Paenibacillus mucilaginosus 3016]|uniref:Uncharacterized protein n=1 Tax=Paenibacillus mucilaginosus 3016 TaxID=1116391 RepID=H6NQI2_9BACL|nr:hypothetical protein [Paenibacillus mucilaginosus]AFC32706.1 hypothetical protein PM3016_6059 [Paenibacillus mucilaginosus 3016]